MDLALGRVKSCPFGADEIKSLKEEIVDSVTSAGHELTRDEADRKDVPIDFRFLDSLLRCAEDPEVGLGDPLDYLEEDASTGTTWRRNCASIGELTEQVVELVAVS